MKQRIKHLKNLHIERKKQKIKHQQKVKQSPQRSLKQLGTLKKKNKLSPKNPNKKLKSQKRKKKFQSIVDT